MAEGTCEDKRGEASDQHGVENQEGVWAWLARCVDAPDLSSGNGMAQVYFTRSVSFAMAIR
jgi:hypothetical protein